MACSISFSFISKCDRAYETEHMNAISINSADKIAKVSVDIWTQLDQVERTGELHLFKSQNLSIF